MLIVLVAWVFCITIFSPNAHAQCAVKQNTNIVVNTDFSLGLQSWSLEKGMYACTDTSLSTMAYDNGTLRVTVNNNYQTCTQQYNWRTFIRGAMNDTLIPNKPYVFTFRVRTNSAQPITFDAAVRKASPNYNWIIQFQSGSIQAINQWQQFCKMELYSGTISANIIEVVFFFGEVPDGTVIWIDDVYVGEPAGYVEEHFIRTNQLGYLVNYPKEASSVDPCSQFHLRDTETNNIVFTGNCLQQGPYPVLSTNNPCINTRDTIWKLDFTGFNTSGNYYIETTNGRYSHPFEINQDIYDQLRKDAQKFFYYQRCGQATLPQYVGNLAHPVCHLQDANADVRDSLFNPVGSKDVLGGWHDAGDYIKYTFNNSLATVLLARAYLENPTAFGDQNGIPESGNGIADIVDELAYNAMFLLKMQNVDSSSLSYGGVHAKVSTQQWNIHYLPHHEFQTRYLTPVTTISTAGFAAAMCNLYRVFRTIPAYQQLAQLTAVAANNAWNYLLNHSQNSIDPVNNPQGPYIRTALYDWYPDIDERLWAAAEMFRTFQTVSAKEYFEIHYTSCNNALLDPDLFSHYQTQHHCSAMQYHQHFAWLGFIAYLEARNPNSSVHNALQSWLLTQANTIRERTNQDFFSFNLRTWHNNYGLLNNAPLLKKAYELTNDVSYLHTIAKNLDYIFGKNIIDHSFVSAFGSRSPLQLNHLQMKNDAYTDIIPAALVGGPPGNSTNNAQTIPVFPSNPGDPNYLFTIYFEPCTIWPKRYADLPYHPFQNEPAIDYNARLVYALYALVPSQPTGTTDISIPLNQGWNMISNPVTRAPNTDSVRHLYPNSVFPYVFSFSPTIGYQQAFAMENGPGFWGKFSADETNFITGTPRTVDSIAVSTGWNIIGSISSAVDTSSVISIPPGIRASNWFGYSGGYTIAPQIIPGLAYWVKANSSGKFVLSAIGNRPEKSHLASVNVLDRFNTLTITDGNGNSQTLYFGVDTNKQISLEFYVMPPLPPSGAFDARFQSNQGGLMVQTHAAQVKNVEEFPILIQTDAYPLSFTWKIKEEATSYELVDGVGGKVFTPKRMWGEGTMTIEGIDRLVLKVSVGEQLPTDYALQQNYPNPFNTSTTIRYELPKESRVLLKVYNILGQEVATIVDEVEPAGWYSVQWDAGNVASAVYFYRLQAGSFVETKKLILLK